LAPAGRSNAPGALHRSRARYAAAAASPIASAAKRISVSVVTSTCGNRVVAVRIAERITSTPTIAVVIALSQPGFVHGPSTALSLHSSSRNTAADGSSTPASAWTAVVIVPSGAPGINTLAIATGERRSPAIRTASATSHARLSRQSSRDPARIAFTEVLIAWQAPSHIDINTHPTIFPWR
jgi:hypothetical protein